jgi:hypothetical protein
MSPNVPIAAIAAFARAQNEHKEFRYLSMAGRKDDGTKKMRERDCANMRRRPAESADLQGLRVFQDGVQDIVVGD